MNYFGDWIVDNLLYHAIQKRLKRIKKQNKDIDKLKDIIHTLASGQSPGSKHHDHQLAGRWQGHRDCHIGPDWILIYRQTADELYLERTGSHAELFR